MLLQQQIASSSPNYELLKFTSVHCLIQSLLQWSPIAIPFVAYLHRYLHIHGDSFLKSYQTYTSHGISPLAPSSPCRTYDSFALPNLYQMSPYVKGQNQAFFFEKGRQDILPDCNDISDNEAQEKEFGLLCTKFTVHNSISNYDCFIILKYGAISSGRKGTVMK
ncbi:unnamed protein product [Sphagnum troendelagicum]